MNQANKLLVKVLKICRAKSSLPNEEWKKLQREINDYLEGKSVDISAIERMVAVAKMTYDKKYKLETEIKRLNFKLKKEVEYRNEILVKVANATNTMRKIK